MRSLLGLTISIALAQCVMAQTVPGKKASLICQPTNTAGATISVTPQGGGKTLGTYSLVSNGQNQTEFRADMSALRPTASRLELMRGTATVKTIPGPSEGVYEYATELAHTVTLESEEDWIWWAVAGALYLVGCVDYEGGTTTTTTGPNGEVTTTETSGQWSWDCAGGITVTVDGTQYTNITGLRIVSQVSGPLPAISSLTFAASGGARITSIR
jgi:hypothetical protein